MVVHKMMAIIYKLSFSFLIMVILLHIMPTNSNCYLKIITINGIKTQENIIINAAELLIKTAKHL
ncbi:hypothetical protein ICMP_422 [Candidatus Ishikawaella capsulata Mpkobe]|uniref:Uncharacterized protein n=1 Tax=Candidatus Ishikawaella capsulata Mpkobe TaxID=476281 RepID=C5WD69_9ENTR|nr:hypothetical protein ICMP_422 [Candidatus Ishikawaella capsulata Mpkobe]